MWNHDLTDLDFLNSSQSASTLVNPHMDSQTEPWMALSLNLHPQKGEIRNLKTNQYIIV